MRARAASIRRWALLTLTLTAALTLPGTLPAGEDAFQALALTRVNPPAAAKDFTAPAPGGGQVSLASYRGKVVFLNFWATWCPPCLVEMPAMERLHGRLRDKGFVVLAISLDADEGAVPPFLKEHGFTFPVGLDSRQRVAALYGVLALPSTFLLDRKGRVVAQALGPREWDGPAALAVIDTLLGQR
ncbi:MAG: TlpA family protein disulfide reductase [Candidatus Rokubacteria bacterium]|nr:TlpA family protein disulfide reductase [Candidatus Rokubacteria bacterium]